MIKIKQFGFNFVTWSWNHFRKLNLNFAATRSFLSRYCEKWPWLQLLWRSAANSGWIWNSYYWVHRTFCFLCLIVWASPLLDMHVVFACFSDIIWSLSFRWLYICLQKNIKFYFYYYLYVLSQPLSPWIILLLEIIGYRLS